MKVNKIVKLGLEQKAHELKTQGLSDTEIAQKLSEIVGEKISRFTVLRYFKSNKDPVVQRAKQREEIISRALNNRLDVVEQLNIINQTMWSIANDALQQGDSKTAIQALKEVREQISLQAKLLGNLPDQQININVNVYNELLRLEQKIIQIVYEVLCDDCRTEFSRKLEEIGEGIV